MRMTSILIADDLDVSRRRLAIILSREGYKVFETEDGSQALRVMRSEHPDLAIIDILMPSMDGFEFARAVRKDETISRTPVIFFSSNFQTEDVKPLARALGVRHVMPKACSLGQILSVIREATSGQVAQDSTDPVNFELEHARLISVKLPRRTSGEFNAALGDCLSHERVATTSLAGARPDYPIARTGWAVKKSGGLG